MVTVGVFVLAGCPPVVSGTGVPVVSEVSVEDITPSGATVRFVVDWRGSTPGPCSVSLNGGAPVVGPCGSIVLSGLAAESGYMGTVTAASAGGASGSAPVVFSTLAPSRPVVSGVGFVAGPTDVTASFSVDWLGFEPGSCELTVDGVGSSSGGCESLSLAGLTPGTYYLGSVVATAATGERGVWPSTEFRTQGSVGVTPVTMVLSSSTNPSLVGQGFAFRVELTGDGGVPTGSVSFDVDNNTVGTSEVAEGVAVVGPLSLPVGSHVVAARYHGDPTYRTATSNLVDQVVNAGGSVTTVSASPDPAVANTDVAVRASVVPASPAAGPVSGVVTFADNGVVFGEVAVDAGGATLERRFATGTHEITATYSGDGSFGPSTGTTTLAVTARPTSKVWIWGENQFGTVGDGTTTGHLEPIQKAIPAVDAVPGEWAVTALGSTGNVSAIDAEGALWGWGFNGYGALGDGMQTSHPNPTRIGTGSDWLALSAASHAIGLQADGSLWGWGLNLGDYVAPGPGDSSFLLSPTRIGTDTDWVSVYASYLATFAVKSDGSLWAWGYNGSGQLGDGTDTARLTPTRIGTATDWAGAQFSGSLGHMAVIKADGSLWTWGDNEHGQLGDGTRVDRFVPTRLGTDRWTSVSADRHTLAVRVDGTLWSWGWNYTGQLGDGTLGGTFSDRPTPAQIGNATNWAQVAAGNSTSHAVRADGTLWGWGASDYGELGDGTATDGSPDPTPQTTPIRIGLTRRWDFVEARGSQNTMAGSHVALPPTTTTVTSSRNPAFTLETVTFRATVVPVAPSTGTPSGTVTFYDGATVLGTGQLADGVATFSTQWLPIGPHDITAQYQGDYAFQPSSGSVFQTVRLRRTATTITATDPPSFRHVNVTFTATVTASSPATGTPTGTVVFTDGPTTLASVPLTNGAASYTTNTLTLGNHRITATFQANAKWATSSNGIDRAIQLAPNLWAWGDNKYGQLGTGNFAVDILTPTRAGATTGWVSVDSGPHSAGIKADGTLWTWGLNDYGQLGNGNASDTVFPLPSQVGTDRDWVQVSTGYRYTLAIKSDGSLWAWGRNHRGQLGNGTTVDSSVPIDVSNGQRWTSAAAGHQTSSGVTSWGGLFSWGSNGVILGHDGDAQSVGAIGLGLNSSGFPVEASDVFTRPTQIVVGERFRSVRRSSGAAGHAVAQTAAGKLMMWSFPGLDFFGQSSDVCFETGLAMLRGNDPHLVSDVTNWTDYAVGDRTTLAIKGGSIFGWGANEGSFGDGTASKWCTPAPAATGSDWVDVAVGTHHGAGVRADGTLWTWGVNSDGELGDGTTNARLSPGQVGVGTRWLAVAVNESSSTDSFVTYGSSTLAIEDPS